ncbi:DEAD domain-containing protein [Citrus sinensis]|nr:DEAD domain-containing protein [Citrus sinensis]
MTKGDDAVMRRRNKAKIKKLNNKNTSSNVSARVAAVIAAKKRRKSGKRRQCQGMCFSLPTLDDPFNDRYDKRETETKATKKRNSLQLDKNKNAFVKGKSAVSKKETKRDNNEKPGHLEQTKEKAINLKNSQDKSLLFIDGVEKRTGNVERAEVHLNGKSCANGHHGQACEKLDCPSKFLILCLNAIENAMRHDGVEQDNPLFVNSWGIEFWKCYSSAKDILETSGSSSTIVQIAWIVATAADSIARKEKEGFSFTGPFLLFLVSSQEKAAKVRSVCKPLKAFGIHTVSLHPGAAIDHQITGLRSCEPEFLVSTPERLLKLVSLKAIDVSGVSLLVVDRLDSLSKGDTLSLIRQSISGKPHTVVFNDCLTYTSVPAVQNLLLGSINRLSLNQSVASQSACIIQSVNVCASDEEKILKGIQVLDHAYGDHFHSEPLKVLYIVGKDSKFQNLVSTLKCKGYSISTGSNCIVSHIKNSVEADGRKRPAVSMIDKDHISTAELEEYEVVIVPDFIISMKNYVEILTSMARHTVSGILHSFFTKDDAAHAGQMIEILEQCGQKTCFAEI